MSFTSYAEYMKYRKKFLENLLPIYNNLFTVSILNYPTNDTILKNNLVKIFTDNIISISSLPNIQFSLHEIPTFNEYNINLINLSDFSLYGELNFDFVESDDYKVTSTFKKIMQIYHNGLNLKRNLNLSSPFDISITVYNKVNNSINNIIKYNIYDILIVELNENTFEYGNKELLNVSVTQSYKYFEIV